MRLRIMALVMVLGCSRSADDVAPGGEDGADAGGPDADGGPALPAGPRLIAGPGEDGFDAALADRARAYDRQFHTFSAPWGLSLDAMIPDAGDRDAVAAFLAQDATDDFAAFGGARRSTWSRCSTST